MGSLPYLVARATIRGSTVVNKQLSCSTVVLSGQFLTPQSVTIHSPASGFVNSGMCDPVRRYAVSGIKNDSDRETKRQNSGKRCHSSVTTTSPDITSDRTGMSMKSQGKEFNKIPGPRKWPVFGNLLTYKFSPNRLFSYHDVLLDLYKKYGPIARQYIGTQVWVHLFDPEDVKTVYLNEGKIPYVPPLQETTQLYRRQNKMSPGLGNTNGEMWYRLRSAVQKIMLRPKDVQHYLPSVDKVAKDFVKKIAKMRNSEGEVSNLRHEVAKWSMESAGMVCFERRLGCMSGGETEALAQDMVSANAEVFYLSGLLKFSLPVYKYINTPKWKRLVEKENFIYSATQQFLDDTLATVQEVIDEGKLKDGQYSFLTSLLSHKDLSRSDISIITLSLFGDGLSTTTPSLQYNLYCLAKNQDAQEKVYQEISSLLSPDEPITVDVLNKITYLKAAVKETFRLFPIGTDISRILQKDLVLSGYHVPAGTHVDFNMLVHFCSEAYFNDPLKYIPERWLRDKEVSSLHPYILNPFGHGTRMCAGRRFAEQDLYALLIHILLHFKLEYPTGEEIKQVYNTLLFPDRPLKVRFKLRDRTKMF